VGRRLPPVSRCLSGIAGATRRGGRPRLSGDDEDGDEQPTDVPGLVEGRTCRRRDPTSPVTCELASRSSGTRRSTISCQQQGVPAACVIERSGYRSDINVAVAGPDTRDRHAQDLGEFGECVRPGPHSRARVCHKCANLGIQAIPLLGQGCQCAQYGIGFGTRHPLAMNVTDKFRYPVVVQSDRCLIRTRMHSGSA